MSWIVTATGMESGAEYRFRVDAPADAPEFLVYNAIGPLLAERQRQIPPLEKLGPPMTAAWDVEEF